MYKDSERSMVFVRSLHCASVNDHHFVNFGLYFAVFKSLVRHNTAGVHVKIIESDATDIATITSVASKTSTASVAHPERRLLVSVFVKHAVIINMIASNKLATSTQVAPDHQKRYLLSAAHEQNSFLF